MVIRRGKYHGVGLFGKIPSRGDFLSSGLPVSFVNTAEVWIREGLAKMRDRENWQAAYLSAPIWQFASARGVWDDSAWCGLIMPSVDSVGRYFPLVVAKPVDAISQITLAALQDIAQQALNPELLDITAWKAQFSDLPEGGQFTRESGLISPPFGCVFRALDGDGSLMYDRIVSRLNTKIFIDMVFPETTDLVRQ